MNVDWTQGTAPNPPIYQTSYQTPLAAPLSSAVAAAYAAAIPMAATQQTTQTQKIDGPICIDWSTREALNVPDPIPQAIIEQTIVDVITVREERPFFPCEKLAITQTLMEMLSGFEAQGFIHADIKPDNLILKLDHDGMYYSLAAIQPSPYSSRFGEFSTIGTRVYAPPFALHQKTFNKHDNKVDSWAAGVSLLLICLSDNKLEEIKDLLAVYNTTAQRRRYVLDTIHPWIEGCRQQLRPNYRKSLMCMLLYHLLDPNPLESCSASQAIEISKELIEEDFFIFL